MCREGAQQSAAKRSPMTSESTTRWPLLEERAPFAHAAPQAKPRRLPRSNWLLIALAFICGGLVSAAGFSIGWRHQAQRDTAAQAALVTANARIHALERHAAALQNSLATARLAAKHQRSAAASAEASEKAVRASAAQVGADATASDNAAASVSSRAGTIAFSTARVSSELKTLETYLTSTPPGQLDPGYIESQTAYLERQLGALKAGGGSLGTAVAGFEAATRKVAREAAALSAP